MRFVEFILIVLAVMVAVAGITFGIDRELARRDYEKYTTTQEEAIIGCLFETNCKYYNDMLDKEDD